MAIYERDKNEEFQSHQNNGLLTSP